MATTIRDAMDLIRETIGTWQTTECAECPESDRAAAGEYARAALSDLRDGRYMSAIDAIEQSAEIEREYGDAPIWGPVAAAVREAVATAIDEAYTEAAWRGLRTVSSGDVIQIDDGCDRWLAWRDDLALAETDPTDDRTLRQRAGVLSEDDEERLEAEADAYQELCDAASVVLSSQGSSSGSRRDRALLLRAAVQQRLIDREDAAEWAPCLRQAVRHG
jgi:hypothetical protein